VASLDARMVSISSAPLLMVQKRRSPSRWHTVIAGNHRFTSRPVLIKAQAASASIEIVRTTSTVFFKGTSKALIARNRILLALAHQNREHCTMLVHKQTKILSWDDLAVILAVARSPSVRAAADLLGVAHTTLTRRIEAAETALGVVAFLRGSKGYAPTDAGQLIIAHAERMESEAETLQRAVAGGDRTLSGVVRVTMPPTILTHLVAAQLPLFRRQFPAIDLHIAAGHALMDLERQQADVAVRAQQSPAQDLVGVRIGAVHEAVYARPDLIQRQSIPGGPPLSLIPWGVGNAFLKRASQFGFASPTLGPVCSDVMSQCALAEAGLGAAILPCFVGDRSSELIRLTPGKPLPAQTIWVLNHADLRRSARVRAAAEFLVKTLRGAKAALDGAAN